MTRSWDFSFGNWEFYFRCLLFDKESQPIFSGFYLYGGNHAAFVLDLEGVFTFQISKKHACTKTYSG